MIAFNTKYSTYFKNVWPLLVLLLLSFGCSDSPKNFTAFLYELAEIDVEERSGYLQDWLKNQEEFPIIDGNDVYFIFKEKREVPVYLVGDMTCCDSPKIQMMKIIGTDYYYVKQSYPTDSGFEYKFVVNGRHFLDPLNKKIFKSEKELGSLLFMPDYMYPIEILTRVNKAYTKIDTLQSDKKSIYFYRHIQAGNDAPLVFFLDGLNYLHIAEAAVILDNLTDEKKIPPCFAFFPEDNSDILESLSFIKNEFQLSGNHAIIGGNKKTALSLIRNPEIINSFDGFFLQSPLADSDSLYLPTQNKRSDFKQKRIFLSHGLFEKQDSVYQKTIAFFQNKTAHFMYQRYNEGASWLSWQSHLDDALIFCINTKKESTM